MIFLFSFFTSLFLIFPSESNVYAQNTSPYTIYNLVDEYIDLPLTRIRYDDFKDQKQTKFDAIELHKSWQTEWDFLIYHAPHVPEITGYTGTLYQSGIYYDLHQQKLQKSYDLLVEIEDEFKSALSLACKICLYKQRIPLQICPNECLSSL